MAEVQIIEKVNGRIDRNKGTIINGPIKVAAYARVSTDKEDQKNSYESQLKYYMEKMNANQKWIATQVYADEAISGTQDYKRSDFMKMIHDALNDNSKIKGKKIVCIACAGEVVVEQKKHWSHLIYWITF